MSTVCYILWGDMIAQAKKCFLVDRSQKDASTKGKTHRPTNVAKPRRSERTSRVHVQGLGRCMGSTPSWTSESYVLWTSGGLIRRDTIELHSISDPPLWRRPRDENSWQGKTAIWYDDWEAPPFVLHNDRGGSCDNIDSVVRLFSLLLHVLGWLE